MKFESSGCFLRRQSALLVLVFALIAQSVSAQDGNSSPNSQLKVMSWNIWHGGREDGEEIGPKRVVEVIKDSGADIVAMQETYGSGEIISKALGFHFQPRGTNLSIHSRYPIVEDISVFEEFKCVGSLIKLPNGQQVAFYCVWLPYGKDIWLPDARKDASVDDLLDACRPSANDLIQIRNLIAKRLSGDAYADVPVMIAGDFNSMSHLDYQPVSKETFGEVVDWTTSHVLMDSGFRDSYREANPVVDREKDSTWSPKFPEQEQDRIDFVYYKSKKWRTLDSKVIRTHADKFPSDHAALITTFRELSDDENQGEAKYRAVSYNVRRGSGMDNKTDILRSAAVLKKLNPDFVGLQEIDLNAKRSGVINQANELGKHLNMHAAFAPFMDFQGGRYGMAVLSRYPFRNVQAIKLPKGNEPRVAIAAEILLPNDESIMLVNVHFDWVKDDAFRFAQASELKRYLDGLAMPYVLLGDFNDEPGSRTLKLFSDSLLSADKPSNDHFTYSSVEPIKEIDFVFASPKSEWEVVKTLVVDEPVASDHRPVVVDFLKRGQKK